MHINSPDLWLPQFPWPKSNDNKYNRGHALILGGPLVSTGATKLAAISALRAGAGLVSVICNPETLPIYATALTSVMTKIAVNENEFTALISSPSVKGVLIGPGSGHTLQVKNSILVALKNRKPTVLDADAFTIFADQPDELFSNIQSPCILTPHSNEFERIFPQFEHIEDRAKAALMAAKISHSVIVLKGSKTFIASPDGRVVINANATEFLATAGSGDVLAGLCVGLLTQGMDPFDAACAAVWLHSEAANLIGPGLISEDLPAKIPHVLSILYAAAPSSFKHEHSHE